MLTRKLARVGLALALTGWTFAQGADGLFTEHLEIEDSPLLRYEAILDLDGGGSRWAVGWFWAGGSARIKLHARRFSEFGEGDPIGETNVSPTVGTWSWHDECGSAGGDLEGDGRDDFVVTLGNDIVVFKNDVPQFGAPFDLEQELVLPVIREDSPRSVLVHDFDQDGLAEVVIAFPDEVWLYRSDANTTLHFVEIGPVVAGLPFHRRPTVKAGDLNGDGLVELLVFSPDLDRVSVFALGSGSLGAPDIQRTDLGGARTQIAVGDIDGDSDTDVVVFQEERSSGPPVFQVLRGNGTGALDPEDLDVGGPASSFVDIDGDGDLDGVWAGGADMFSTGNDSPSTFRITLNDGTGRFDIATTIDGLGAHKLAGTVDIDNDGDIDIFAGRGAIYNTLGFGTTYCEGAANSTGAPGVLSASGSPSDRSGDLLLHLEGLPPGALYLLINNRFGPFTSVPVGGGTLCIGHPFRSNVGQADATGAATIDLGPLGLWGLPVQGFPQRPVAGDAVLMQVWHRDTPAHSFSNLTNVLSILVTP